MRDAATQHVHEMPASARALDTLHVVLFDRTARGIMREQTAAQFESGLLYCLVAYSHVGDAGDDGWFRAVQ
jgi:hypothetical protein